MCNKAPNPKRDFHPFTTKRERDAAKTSTNRVELSFCEPNVEVVGSMSKTRTHRFQFREAECTRLYHRLKVSPYPTVKSKTPGQILAPIPRSSQPSRLMIILQNKQNKACQTPKFDQCSPADRDACQHLPYRHMRPSQTPQNYYTDPSCKRASMASRS